MQRYAVLDGGDQSVRVALLVGGIQPGHSGAVPAGLVVDPWDVRQQLLPPDIAGG